MPSAIVWLCRENAPGSIVFTAVRENDAASGATDLGARGAVAAPRRTPGRQRQPVQAEMRIHRPSAEERWIVSTRRWIRSPAAKPKGSGISPAIART